jgi:hypothetical protein
MHFNDESVAYSVITLNYDMLLESVCKYLNSTYLDEGLRQVEFAPHPSNQVKDECPLIKLHGSVHDRKIIPPTFGKGLYQPELPMQWRLAYGVLSKANEIRIIGYSLPKTDAYIKFMLKAAISSTLHLSRIDVICLDDNIEHQVEERYREFVKFPNFDFSSARTEDYCGYIGRTKLIDRKQSEGRDAKIVTFNSLERAHREFMQNNSSQKPNKKPVHL